MKAEPRYEKATTTGRRGANHEKRIAKRSGDTRVSGSGAKPGRPGDLRGLKFLREAKTTKGAGRTISGKELLKISAQALSVGLEPIMEICFEGQEPPTPRDWVLIPADVFEELIRRSGYGGHQ
jgi:hypothetical protein